MAMYIFVYVYKTLLWHDEKWSLGFLCASENKGKNGNRLYRAYDLSVSVAAVLLLSPVSLSLVLYSSLIALH